MRHRDGIQLTIERWEEHEVSFVVRIQNIIVIWNHQLLEAGKFAVSVRPIRVMRMQLLE